MRSIQKLVPMHSKDVWHQVNQAVRMRSYSESEAEVRCFTSQLQALVEIVGGTGHFLSHKKNVSIFWGSNPYFSCLSPSLIRDGKQVANLGHEDLPMTLVEAQKWVEALPKDTAYVLFSEDHLVTAQLYPWDLLDEALNEKRILSLRISHHQHNFDQKKIRPFSVRICVLDLEHVVALVGARVRLPTGTVAGMNWDLAFVEEIRNLKEKKDLIIDPGVVQSFEAQFITERFLSPDTDRVFDRALLCFKDINSDRLIQGIQTGSSGFSGTGLCSWSAIQAMNDWWQPQPTNEQLRGLLIIPTSFLIQERVNGNKRSNDFEQELRKLCDEIRKSQTWGFRR